MKITCPNCGVSGSLEMFLNDALTRAVLKHALELPAPLSKQILTYIGLFRPAKRALTWDRVEKLLNELLEPIKAGRVERGGRTWSASTSVWQAALEEMLGKREKLRLPLKTHGFLFEVVAGLADKDAAAEERSKEKQLIHKPRSYGLQEPADSLVEDNLAMIDQCERLGQRVEADRIRQRVIELLEKKGRHSDARKFKKQEKDNA